MTRKNVCTCSGFHKCFWSVVGWGHGCRMQRKPTVICETVVPLLSKMVKCMHQLGCAKVSKYVVRHYFECFNEGALRWALHLNLWPLSGVALPLYCKLVSSNQLKTSIEKKPDLPRTQRTCWCRGTGLHQQHQLFLVPSQWSWAKDLVPCNRPNSSGTQVFIMLSIFTTAQPLILNLGSTALTPVLSTLCKETEPETLPPFSCDSGLTHVLIPIFYVTALG